MKHLRQVLFNHSIRRSIRFMMLLCCAAVLAWQAFGDDPKPAAPRDARPIQSIQGPALYKAYCASCHGADGKGGGPMAPSLKVPPADLTRITARNGGTFPMARVSRIIAGEQQLPQGHGSRAMPVWGPIFSRVEADQDLGRVRIDNLARYLRGLNQK